MQILPDFSVRRAGATTATTAPARLARGVPGRRPRPARLPGVLLEFFSAKDREADFLDGFQATFSQSFFQNSRKQVSSNLVFWFLTTFCIIMHCLEYCDLMSSQYHSSQDP